MCLWSGKWVWTKAAVISHCVEQRFRFFRKNYDHANSGPMDNGCPCFEVVNTFQLTIAADDEACFKFIEGAIRKALALENPFRRQDLDTSRALD